MKGSAANAFAQLAVIAGGTQVTIITWLLVEGVNAAHLWGTTVIRTWVVVIAVEGEFAGALAFNAGLAYRTGVSGVALLPANKLVNTPLGRVTIVQGAGIFIVTIKGRCR